MSECVESRVEVPTKRGFACNFYTGLSSKTAHLRDRVYIVVEVDGLRFEPYLPWEHFPGVAIQTYIHSTQKIPGAGHPLVARFLCSSPEGSGAAQEAADLLAKTIIKVERRTRDWSRWKRKTAAVREGKRYRDSTRGKPQAYRPPVLSRPGDKGEGVGRVFIRFGDLPEEGISRQSEKGLFEFWETGVSVFAASKTPGEEEYTIELPTRAISLIFAWALGANRPAYIIEGTELYERGASGEPLLTNARIVREIDPDSILSTDPEVDIRFRNEDVEKWSRRRQRGRLGPRDRKSEEEHWNRADRELEEDYEEAIGGSEPASKATAEGWPEFGVLSLSRPLGLARGVWLVEDPDCRRYVLTYTYNAEHLREQAAAEDCYRALRVPVPDSAIYEPEKVEFPEPARNLKRFIEGRSFTDLEFSPTLMLRKRIASNFAVDALLGNTDVVGRIKDKALLSTDGTVYRLDTRGALRYLWTGQKKPPGVFDSEVLELETMRHTMGISGEVFGNLTDEDVARQIEEMILPKKGALLDVLSGHTEELREVLAARIQYMEEWAKGVQPVSPIVEERVRQGMGDAPPDLVVSLIEEVRERSTCPGKEYGIHGRLHCSAPPSVAMRSPGERRTWIRSWCCSSHCSTTLCGNPTPTTPDTVSAAGISPRSCYRITRNSTSCTMPAPNTLQGSPQTTPRLGPAGTPTGSTSGV